MNYFAIKCLLLSPRASVLALCTILFAGGSLVVSQATAKPTVKGYRVSEHWPTGVHEGLFDMNPVDSDLCHAFQAAANRIHNGAELDFDNLKWVDEKFVPAGWQAVSLRNITEIAEAVSSRDQWFRNDVERGAALGLLQNKLGTGEARLEWAEVPGLRNGEANSKVVRLFVPNKYEHRGSKVWFGDELAVVLSDDFEQQLPFYGLGKYREILSYQGKSFALGIGYRVSDDAFKPLIEEQQELYLYRPYEGPGVSEDRVNMVRVCTLHYGPTIER